MLKASETRLVTWGSSRALLTEELFKQDLKDGRIKESVMREEEGRDVDVVDDLVRQLYLLTDPSLIRSKIDSLKKEAKMVKEWNKELKKRNQILVQQNERLKRKIREYRARIEEEKDVFTQIDTFAVKIDQIVSDVNAIHQRKRQLVSQMMQNRGYFDIDEYTKLRNEVVMTVDQQFTAEQDRYDGLGDALEDLKEKVKTTTIELKRMVSKKDETEELVKTDIVFIQDQSLHTLWEVSMLTRYTFRGYFGLSHYKKAGFFVDRQLTKMIHSYLDWLDYPIGDHAFEQAHSDRINAVVVSDDGRYLFSGSRDKSIKVWDLSQNEEIHQWQAHSHYVTSLAYCSPFLVSGGGKEDCTIRVWNAYTFELIHTMEGHSDTVTVVKLNERGTRIVSGSADRTVRIWSVKSGECEKIFREHIDTVRALQWRAQIVISGAKDATVKVWDPHTLRVSREIVDEACPPGTGKKKGWVTELCLNCDSSLMFCNRRKISAMIYAWPSFEVRQILGFPSFCGCFHPWIPHLLALCDRNDESIKLVDTRDGRCIRIFFAGEGNGSRDMCFTRDGHRLISTGSDIRIWDTSDVKDEPRSRSHSHVSVFSGSVISF